MKEATMPEIKDALGVSILVGDVVRVIYHGYGITLPEVGLTAVVVGFSPRRNLVHNTTIKNGNALRPDMVAVQRRDGAPGHEGNRI
jgi:hypothetical protein